MNYLFFACTQTASPILVFFNIAKLLGQSQEAEIKSNVDGSIISYFQ